MEMKNPAVTATVTDDPQLASAQNEAASAPPPPDDLGDPEPAEEKLVEIKNLDDEDQRRVTEFMKQVVEARMAREKAEQPVPPPPMTERQKTQIEEEQEAGRRAVAKHAEQQKLRPPPPARDPGSSNPVFRPGDYVPDMSKGNVGARDVPPRT